MEKLEPFIETLEQLGNDIPQIVELSKKSGQRVGHVVLAIVAVTAILVLIFLGPLILSVAITVIYPAYKSIEALESKDSNTKLNEYIRISRLRIAPQNPKTPNNLSVSNL